MTEIEILKYYDLLYYNEGNSTISDAEYDRLKEEVRSKYPDHPYFSTVGANVDGETVKLPYILGSLNKVKPDTVRSYFKDREVNEYLAISKIDGVSIYVEYYQGEVVFASTRGNGYEGKDITQKAKVFCRPVSYKEHFKIRGEATLLFDDHKKVGYKNRRNGAAGILNKKESTAKTKLIHPIFYEIIDGPEDLINKNEIAKFKFLSELGLDIPDFAMLGESLLDQLLFSFKENAMEYGYDIDGLVLKPIEYERENVYYPKEMVAFKMNDVPVKALVTGVEWNLSRQGKLKPVVSIRPIEIGGVTVSRATGFNAEFIVHNCIGVGAEITIVRSGDVIPHIMGVTKKVNPVTPGVCPHCKKEIGWKGVDIVCENPVCGGNAEKQVAYFLRTLGAENITETTIKNLGLKTIEECYEIDEFDIADKDGFGMSSGEQFVNEVKRTLITKPEKLIKALGIDGVGETVGKLIVDHYKISSIDDFSKLFDATAGELEKIDGIGPITAEKFINNIKEYGMLVSFLFSEGLQFEETKVSSISGKIFTLTGKGPMSRQNVEMMITSNGGLVKSLTKKTDYLVTADVDSQSGKAKKARSYGVPMISYEELIKMIEGV
jgi:DNA ligase (NAD+)